MAVTYDIKAHPTVYNGRRYRSRLEAKWAAFFDLLGWPHEYEPVDFGPWSPDFALIGAKGAIYVEIKPITELDRDVLDKMHQVPGEHLLLGLSPIEDIDAIMSWKRLGWLVGTPKDQDANDWFVGGPDTAQFCLIGKAYDFCGCNGYWGGRITGVWDGKNHMQKANDYVLDALWHEASNAVQWRAR